jgi:hypothetical protein
MILRTTKYVFISAISLTVKKSRNIPNYRYFGSWTETYKCPKGYYISGTAPYFEKYTKGEDNSALNGLDIYCRDIAGSGVEQRLIVKPGAWGT